MRQNSHHETVLSPMNCIDLFSGCGGLTLGLHNAGIRGIFAIEKSKDAFQTLKHNLIDKENYFDWPDWLEIKEHSIHTILSKHRDKLTKLKGKVALLAGGPPCQGFSLAGKRNREDKRNSLVHSYLRMVKLVEPKFIFLENVKGFTIPFAKNGKIKKYSQNVIDRLSKMGYTTAFRLVDFSEFGIPQRRTRFILFGVLGTGENEKMIVNSFFKQLEEKRKDFCKEKGLNATSVSIIEAIDDLRKSHGTYIDNSKRFVRGSYGKATSPYQYLMRRGVQPNDKPNSHRFANHTREIEKRFQKAIASKMTPTDYRNHFHLRKSSTKRLIPTEPTPTLTTLPDDYIHYSEPRILTVREYARVQSFPDDFEFRGKYTTGGLRRVLEVPRYTQIGNAIPPLFGELTGKILKELYSAYCKL